MLNGLGLDIPLLLRFIVMGCPGGSLVVLVPERDLSA